jgi:hypothetical protein
MGADSKKAGETDNKHEATKHMSQAPFRQLPLQKLKP